MTSEKRFDFSLGACKIYDKQEERLLEDTEVCGLLNEFDKKSKKRERQLMKAMAHLASDTCSLSDGRFREIVEEIKNA